MPATLEDLAAEVADEIVRAFDDRTTAWRFDGDWEVHFAETRCVTMQGESGFLTAPRALVSVSWNRNRPAPPVVDVAWCKEQAEPRLASLVERIVRIELPHVQPSQRPS